MNFLQGLCIFSIILLSNSLIFASITPERKAEAVRLTRETQNFREVARRLNTSWQNVKRWVRAEEQRTGQQIVPPRQRFTPEQKAEAVRLARETQNFREAARRLNTSWQNVERWVRAEEQRTGQQIVPPRPPRQRFTPEQKAEAVRLAGETQNFSEAARRLNTSYPSVERWVRAEEQRTGQQIVLVPPQQRFTPEQKAEAVRLAGETQNFSEAARRLNTSYQSVERWVQRMHDVIEKLKEYGFSNEIQEAIKNDVPSFIMVGNIEDVIKHIEETEEICTEALIDIRS